MKNQLGYNLIPYELHRQLFPGQPREEMDPWQLKQAQKRLGKVGLEVTDRNTPMLAPELPDTGGIPPFEFVTQIAHKRYGGVFERMESFTQAKLPPFPSKLVIQPGWTRYSATGVTQVEYPLEGEMVCDVETYVKGDNFAVMAGAVTSKAWYLWLHPAIVYGDFRYKRELVPVGTGKLIVNHSVKFDAARFLETYRLFEPSNHLWDTMAAHQAVCGMSHKQRDSYILYKEGSFFPGKWVGVTSLQSLVECYNLHVGGGLTSGDKKLRDVFVKGSLQDIHEAIQDLSRYCLLDCRYTFELNQALWQKWKRNNPHIISFAGHLIQNTTIYPVASDWQDWIYNVDKVFLQTSQEVSGELNQLATDIHSQWVAGQFEPANDPWLSGLDWTPGKSGKSKGYAAWYRKALKPFNKKKGEITLKSDLAPLLLRLLWLGKPVVKISGKGWCFESDEPEFTHNGKGYRRIPHKKGTKQNCGNPLGKDYVGYWGDDDNTLQSGNNITQEILKKAHSCAYWASIQKRVRQYLTHPFSDVDALGLCPQWVATGTSSKRAVEELWLTVSGAKRKVIGSETRSKIQAPAGYRLLLTDFDTQELRIAAIYADCWASWGFGYEPGWGQTALSLSLIIGDKATGDDAHSVLARSQGIDRNLAKSMNFQMLYLCGVTGLMNTIRAHNPKITPEQARAIAKDALEAKRGQTPKGMVRYTGGTDSEAYNFMLKLAEGEKLPQELAHLQPDDFPRSPLLGSAMSEAIQNRNTGRGEYANSRANWGIQTTGVDLLHFTTVALEWLFEHYGVKGRYLLSYHDEVGSLVAEEQVKEGARCHQIAHIWAWTALVSRLGFHDLPDSWAWFSGVNVDTVYRKEVTDSILTPSNSQDEPPGICLTPAQVWS